MQHGSGGDDNDSKEVPNKEDDGYVGTHQDDHEFIYGDTD